MTTRRLAFALVGFSAVLVALAWVFIRPPVATPPDLPALNDIASRLAADGAAVGGSGYQLPRPRGAPDYAVLDADGRLIAATGPEAATSLAEAVARQDTVLDLRDGDRLTGQVLFATGDEAARAAGATRLRWAFTALVIVLVGAAVVALWRLDRALLRPFREMEGFARQVAGGDLDAPLRMDKANAFGAFTEAFDLMRQELAAARDRERQADRAKRELVASLGHDMKTPVASIKAVAELMEARNRDPETAARLAVIGAKADQIDALASDLLAGALQELDALPVSPREVSSCDLARLVAEADHLGWADGIVLPDCLVRADPLRWAQAVGNVVANAYKYGAPPLTVIARIAAEAPNERRPRNSRGSLTVTLADAGPGVSVDELALVTRKFYRGAAGAGKPGAGLGLYLAQHLMERMGGQLVCGAADPGFKVTLRLPLV
ncbi:MAG: HAMP domain-containing histidine kinase [Bifidobacteriaceae bacterium]|jgi:signal transduction histidine kinase|nr:HAMP domain-containing histidine kinase [Bifidobacteriaceae bacterium]